MLRCTADARPDAEQIIPAFGEAQDAVSQVNLARLYNRGLGVPTDPKRAATLLLTAYRANNEVAAQEFAVNLTSYTRETRTEVKRELQRLGHYKGVVNDVWDAPAKVAANAYRARTK